MTSKREWKRREAMCRREWYRSADVAIRYIDRAIELEAERDAAIAERDLARDAAVALEGDYAALVAWVVAEHPSIRHLADRDGVSVGETCRRIAQPWPNVGGAG